MSTAPLSFTELESTAQPDSKAAAPVTPAETKPPDAPAPAPDDTKPQFTDTDVAAYRQLQDLGITTSNAQEFIQAKQWLGTIAYALQNDPKAVIDELRKTSPQLADRLVEVASDEWYERKGKYLNTDPKANGGTSSAPTSEPDPRVEQLAREVTSLKQRLQTEDETKQQQAIVKGYETALDGLAAKLPTDLSDEKKEHIRLKAEKLAWNDPSARARINKGDYTDLPKYFAEASRRVTADTKAATDKERAARAGVESRGSKELPPGTENTVGATEQKPGADPVWGNITEAEVAAAYRK